MSWRDFLVWAQSSNALRKQASFKGAPFFLSSSGATIGQRNKIHIYPKKTYPFVENLGTNADEFSVEGYVIQNSDNDFNYFPEKEALIAALKDPEPGILIHPFYGQKKVVLNGNVEFRENLNADSGIVRFTMPFIEVKEVKTPFPKKIIDPVNELDKAVQDAEERTRDGFGTWYNPAGIPSDDVFDWALSYKEMLARAIVKLQKVNPAQIDRALVYLEDQYLQISPSDACKFGNDILGMANAILNAAGIIGGQITNNIFGECSGVVRGIYDGPMSGAKRLEEQIKKGFGASTLLDVNSINEKVGKGIIKKALEVNSFGESNLDIGSVNEVEITSESNARLAANQISFINMARFGAIASAVRIAPRINYTSYESVTETLVLISEEIDTQLLKIGDDVNNDQLKNYDLIVNDNDSYNSLKDLKSSLTKVMIEIGSSLARILEYKVSSISSVLNLAYDKYEDLNRVEDILERNPTIEHPGFLPEQQDLEILSE